jgi:hypothetical protein
MSGLSIVSIEGLIDSCLPSHCRLHDGATEISKYVRLSLGALPPDSLAPASDEAAQPATD